MPSRDAHKQREALAGMFRGNLGAAGSETGCWAQFNALLNVTSLHSWWYSWCFLAFRQFVSRTNNLSGSAWTLTDADDESALKT